MKIILLALILSTLGSVAAVGLVVWEPWSDDSGPSAEDADYKAAAGRLVQRQLDHADALRVFLAANPFPRFGEGNSLTDLVASWVYGPELESLRAEWRELSNQQATIQPPAGWQETHGLWAEAATEVNLTYESYEAFVRDRLFSSDAADEAEAHLESGAGLLAEVAQQFGVDTEAEVTPTPSP